MEKIAQRLGVSFADYVVTADERYGRHALEWMEVFASWPQWGSGEETDFVLAAHTPADLSRTRESRSRSRWERLKAVDCRP